MISQLLWIFVKPMSGQLLLSPGKRLRDAGLMVKHHSRNLGGHLCFSRAVTNATIQQRIKASEDFWAWLSRSPAPLHQKELALITAAWPKMLHGISIVHLGTEHFTKLRTRALEALGIHKMGTTPSIQLACVSHPHHDPGFMAFWQTLKTFRKFCVPEIAFPVLTLIVASQWSHPKPGPCSVFLARLFEVGWRWSGQGVIHDHEGLPLHVLNDPVQLLYQRAICAWQLMVCTNVSSREGFQGLEFADARLTVAKWNKWDNASQGVLRVALNGTFFTRNKQWVAGHLPNINCPWCGEPDSIHHRHWECAHFQSSRDKLSTQTLRQLHDAPQSLLQHGWIPSSPCGVLYRQLLVELPDLTGEFVDVPNLPATDLHIFTDGSCKHPASEQVRRSTWGTCVADLMNDEFFPISRGPLPGLLQTIVRAEYTAAISGVKFALYKQQKFWLWVDNQQVHEFLVAIFNGGELPSNTEANHDLQVILGKLCQEAMRVELMQPPMKVRSHQDIHMYTDIVEQWVIRGNQKADETAAMAQQDYSATFQQVWEQLVSDVQQAELLRDDIHGHFVRVGLTATEAKSEIRDRDEFQWDEPSERVEQNFSEMPISLTTVGSKRFIDVGNKFKEVAQVVHQWISELVSAIDATPQWLTYHQLLVDFQGTTGHPGVFFKLSSKKYMPLEQWYILHEYSFSRVARWFGAYLKGLAKQWGETYTIAMRRPSGHSYRCWAMCLYLPISKQRVERIDQIWQRSNVSPVTTCDRAFRDIAVYERFQWPDPSDGPGVRRLTRGVSRPDARGDYNEINYI